MDGLVGLRVWMFWQDEDVHGLVGPRVWMVW